MKSRWYLVQVEIESSLKIDPIFTNKSKYYFILLANISNYKHKRDK